MSSLGRNFGNFWIDEKRSLYSKAMADVIRQIEIIDNAIFVKSGNHIIRHVESRLKSNESIIEKLKRKGKYGKDVDVEKAISDLAGIRIICFDTRQVFLLVKQIKKQNLFKIIKEKNYISHPKENGYQSYHMVVEHMGVKVEIQIRTILMDAWSSLETVLIYKKVDRPPEDVIEKINKFSKWSRKMDRLVEEMLTRKDEENE